ncbi:MAG: DUF3179 domain-containing protein [Anaerolineales bacterium]|nr:DUF3179 domain-containing protein [Anaerolineales bacterium]
MKRCLRLCTLLLLSLVACQPAADENATLAPTPLATTVGLATVEPTSPVAESPSVSHTPAGPSPTATSATEPTAPTIPPGPLPDAAAQTLLYQLTGDDGLGVYDAAEAIQASGDSRFVAAFIELIRASQLNLSFVNPDYWAYHAGQLAGVDLGADWAAWIDWYGASDLTPPPGFTGWKGELLGRIDPLFADFLADNLPSNIRVEEIQWGGVRVDGIPALDHALQIPAAEATYLEPGEPVFGIALNGEAHAYPLRIIDWHEMANDTVGGVPLSLAYCTLCGAAIAYHGVGSDGVTYDFGSSGFLYRSNKLMYDRQTRTLWNQLTGEPVLGPLAGTGVKLELLPVVLTSWAAWQAQHPETLVLDINTGFDRPYEVGAAYGAYFASNGTMFPVWQRSDLLETKAQVYALIIDGTAKAYPLELLTAEEVVNDTLAGQELVLVARRGFVEADGQDRRFGPISYAAGAEVRVFARDGHTFTPGEALDELVDETGRIWTITEAALVSEDGAELPRISGHLAYWFGWFAFFPNTLVYGES